MPPRKKANEESSKNTAQQGAEGKPQGSAAGKKQQATLARAFEKGAAAKAEEQPPPGEFKEQLFHHLVISEQLFSTARPLYDKYCLKSPLLKNAEDKEGVKEADADTSNQPKPVRKSARRSNSLGSTNTDTDEAEAVRNFDPSWEQHGIQFVAALEPLVTAQHGLQRYLQEFLIHIMLNHGSHQSNLSVRALRLLLHNAQLHPPCSIPKDGPLGQVNVNKELWVPSDNFRFLGSVSPPMLDEGSQLERLISWWDNARQRSMAAMEESGALSARERQPASSKETFSPGQVLLLQLCTHLLQADLAVRLSVLADARCKAFVRAGQLLRRSVMWQTLATGPCMSSAKQAWYGHTRNCVELLKLVVLTLLGSYKPPHQIKPPSSAKKASKKGRTPQPATPQVAKTKRGSTPGGLTPAMIRSEQQQELLRSCPLTPAELTSMAAWMLSAWSDMYARAELSPQGLYDLGGDSGTDHFFMCRSVCSLLAGHAQNQDQDQLARSLQMVLKDPEARMLLLSAFSPTERITLLAWDFVDMASTAWASYTTSSAGSKRPRELEGVSACKLPSGLEMLQEYKTKSGQDCPAYAQVDPLQVLACLAPADAVQEASRALPSLEDSLKGASDLFEQAKRKLLKGYVAANDYSGFTMWLGAYVRASMETQQREHAGSPQAAALCSLAAGICARIDQDVEKGSTYEETISAQLSSCAVRHAIGAC